MYPTLTRYAGPAKANMRRHIETCDVPTLECTSDSNRACSGTIDLTIVKSRPKTQVAWRGSPGPRGRTAGSPATVRGTDEHRMGPPLLQIASAYYRTGAVGPRPSL